MRGSIPDDELWPSASAYVNEHGASCRAPDMRDPTGDRERRRREKRRFMLKFGALMLVVLAILIVAATVAVDLRVLK